jgi:transmembrane sensor
MTRGRPAGKQPIAEPAARIEQLAAAWDWVLRLRDDTVHQGDLVEWLCWYEADEAHRSAFTEMQAFWRNAGQVIEGADAPTLAQLLGESATLSADTPEPAYLSAPTTRRERTALLCTAALVVTCTLSVWWLHQARLVGAPVIPARSTLQEATLPDGSRVDLAPRSSMVLHFTPRERALELQGGEAYFSVARNRQRPFVVTVARLRVNAVGTAFNIRKAADRIVVAVTEGAVDVHVMSGGSSGATRIVAGHQATWDADELAPVLTSANLPQTLAWQRGRLEYVNEPLADVIADVNRYLPRPVTIRDPAVGQIKFSGTVFTESSEVWLRALPQVFPVQLDTDGQGGLALLRAPPP